MSRTIIQISLSGGFALVMAGSLLVNSSVAALIDVKNHSFESPALADGGSWKTDSSGTYYDWAFVPVGGLAGDWVYFRNPNATYFTNANDDSSTSGVPHGGDGTNSLNLVLSNTGGSGTLTGNWTVSQTLADVFEAGTYTLTVAVGCPGGNRVPVDDYSISVLSGSTVLGSYAQAGSGLPTLSFTDRSVTFDVLSDSAYLGDPITIRLFAEATVDTNQWKQMCFDNVRLDFAAVPEPGTIGLLVTGLIGMLSHAFWKRRRRGGATV